MFVCAYNILFSNLLTHTPSLLSLDLLLPVHHKPTHLPPCPASKPCLDPMLPRPPDQCLPSEPTHVNIHKRHVPRRVRREVRRLGRFRSVLVRDDRRRAFATDIPRPPDRVIDRREDEVRAQCELVAPPEGLRNTYGGGRTRRIGNLRRSRCATRDRGLASRGQRRGRTRS